MRHIKVVSVLSISFCWASAIPAMGGDPCVSELEACGQASSGCFVSCDTGDCTFNAGNFADQTACEAQCAADCASIGSSLCVEAILCADYPPVGACCDPLGDCTEITQSDCEAVDGGVYQGDDTLCADTECPRLIPAASEWGLAAMALLGLSAGTLVFRRRAIV